MSTENPVAAAASCCVDGSPEIGNDYALVSLDDSAFSTANPMRQPHWSLEEDESRYGVGRADDSVIAAAVAGSGIKFQGSGVALSAASPTSRSTGSVPGKVGRGDSLRIPLHSSRLLHSPATSTANVFASAGGRAVVRPEGARARLPHLSLLSHQ